MGLLSSIGNVVSKVTGQNKQESNNTNALWNYLGLGGLSLGQSFLSDYFNRQAAARQNSYTYSLMDYSNSYNLPANMRARLEEAGYNPNLALNGVNVQSATGSTPQVKPSQVDLLSAYNLGEQNELLKKQQMLTEENTNNARIKGLLDGRKANLLYYQDKYAEKEYEMFKKTGKIPESYYKTGGLFGQLFSFADRILENM